MKKYLPTIGLEIHAELKTKSKMFCGCKNSPFTSRPNENVCPVCLGLPGALPVINKQAVIDTIKIGKAFGGTIAPITKWDRKHYFYPDLPKGYQISQFDMPIVSGGQIAINSKSETLNSKQIQNSNDQNQKPSSVNYDPSTVIRITRIHLEEDTGKLMHEPGSGNSLVDLNRAGVPLVELVTEPDIHDGKTASEFAKEYQLILRTLGVADADMEKGMMRVEVNISLQPISNFQFPISNKIPNSNDQNQKSSKNQEPRTENQLGTKVEIKNLNSFKSVKKAIEYEIKRQSELLEKGEKVTQETRGWDAKKGITVSQRIKETSADYRYFPEPDLPPIDTSKLIIPKLSPLPHRNREMLAEAGLDSQTIDIVINNPELMKRIAEFSIFNFQFSDKSQNSNSKIDLAGIAKMLINEPKLLEKSDDEIIKLVQMSSHERKMTLNGSGIDKLLSEDEIKLIVKDVLKKNVEAVSSYKNGKKGIFGFFVGQVMTKTKGQADPQLVNKIIESKLDAMI